MKTLILLTACVGGTVSQELVNQLTGFVGIMNTDKKYKCAEMPGVVYNGILTDNQKAELKEFISTYVCDVAPLYIEFQEKDDEEFNGTLQFKLNTNE